MEEAAVADSRNPEVGELVGLRKGEHVDRPARFRDESGEGIAYITDEGVYMNGHRHSRHT